MTTATDNRAAVNAFIDERAEVLDLLARLTEHVDNHCDLNPDAVTWQHAGDMAHLREQLAKLVPR